MSSQNGRDLTSGVNDDAVVTMPSPVAEQEATIDRCRSRVTQYGNSCLEIEIPRRGITSSDRWSVILLPPIPAIFLLIGIPLTLMLTLLYGMLPNWWISSISSLYCQGPSFLAFLSFVAFPLLFYVCIISNFKLMAFSQINLKITRDSYSLLRKNIAWKSYFQILCFPSHFDDLDNGDAIETVLEDSQHPRIPSLQAEVLEDADPKSCSRYIKLGSISFAHGFLDGELEWLTQEINRFLYETC